MNRGMTLAQIAAAEECSVTTVQRTLNSAVSKLQQIPGSFTAIISSMWSMDVSGHDPLEAQSAECRQDWVERYRR